LNSSRRYSQRRDLSARRAANSFVHLEWLKQSCSPAVWFSNFLLMCKRSLSRVQRRSREFFIASLVIMLLSAGLAAADPFAENVRKTDPLTPAAQLKTFHLPPGFGIQLFASEPEIAKPMNMAFDAKGRLWITESQEYPFPVKPGTPGRDAIKILEDTNGDGRADKITTFADGLNIPIGLYPWRGGVIAFSIPHIYFFEDTNGDGRADKREIFYGPFGWERDTHGMTSAFRRGFDGWLYACHGFNNTTTVKGKDGHTITMNSGNTYRMRIDGSRVEQFTWGQVNPFGLAFDPFGGLYSADCHSSPIYQLLRGGYYPSFGKPHDGLGFAPTMMTHSHGSTAIGGIVYYDDTRFPAEFRGNFFIGNVMTCRINRDSVIERGSTWIAKEEPDFLRSDDPWFRPVDLQLGPDGAMYVADFYNRIIGHYEVPLDHPGRDRERGRIWRIAYRGEGNQAQATRRFDSSTASAEELVRQLGHDNLTIRMTAMDQLTDRIGKTGVSPLREALSKSPNAFQRAHGIWVLHRLGGLEENRLVQAAQDSDRLVRVHAMRILSETPTWTSRQRALALAGLRDPDALVQRAAADALGRQPHLEHVRPLLEARQSVPAEDTHLLHTVRMALRNQLLAGDVFRSVPFSPWSEADSAAVADVALGVPSAESADYLLTHLKSAKARRETMVEWLRHVARYLPESRMDDLAQLAQSELGRDIDLQLGLFKSVQEGMAQRGAGLSAGTRDWGAGLARELIQNTTEGSAGWHNSPMEGMANQANPWFLQQRRSADGDQASWFLCSLPPGGEQLTGILRSPRFRIPERFSFFIAGHDGYPERPAQGKNAVRLRSAVSGEILAETAPPRNDTAQRVTWELGHHAGTEAFLEIIDGDNGNAYAWLAIGRFDPPLVPLPSADPSKVSQRLQAAAELVRTLSLRELEAELRRILNSPSSELASIAAAARALAGLNPNPHVLALAAHIDDASLPLETRKSFSRTLAANDPGKSEEALAEALRQAPYRVQLKLAQTLAGSPVGADKLIDLAAKGQIPPRLLSERAIRDRVVAARPEAAPRVAKLTEHLPPTREAVQKLIETRRQGFSPGKARVSEGARIYSQNCAACHQIGGQGGLVGPQLDGIGNRGLERLLEDVLDPNRNVDHAFQSHLFILDDGDVISGLPRREEGEVLVVADSTGKEIQIPKSRIREQSESDTSLMPENYADILSAEEIDHLMAFLLSTGGSR
jgi:putative heme-binding domain-containing protein